VKNRADARKMVIDDWKRAQNVQVIENENEDDIRALKFKFSFNSTTIGAAQMKLPLEYETNIASFMEKVEANPPITFDDMVPFEHVEQLDFEV
jgi:hypothetical protein